MRNDLTTAFIAAMTARSREPIQYMQIILPDRTLYLSDQDRDIYGQAYDGVVEEWGEITTAGTETNDIISETLQMSVTFWNGGDVPFSFEFLDIDPTDLHVFVYQTFEGLLAGDAALVGEFVIQDPISIAEAARTFSVDLVSVNMRFTASVGSVLSRDDWPFALDADVNKGIDLIVGDAGAVQTLCSRTPLVATMSGSILKLPTTINVHENLDELGFAAAGRIVIDEEILHYSARDSDSFFVDARGQLGTIATDHSDGATTLEYITDHTYLIGQGALDSVSDVRVGGLPVDPGEYSVDLVADPARIVFPKQPTFVRFSRGARTTESNFDATAGDNSAFQPHYSYDTNFRSYGALISKVYRTLSILQIDDAVDDGEVVRAFLAVEHWSTKLWPSDRVDVYVDGLGLVGSLSRPSSSDITTIDANVDIDHGHDHEAGGIHDHSFGNPGLSTNNPAHDHSTAGTFNDNYYSPQPAVATYSGSGPTHYPTNPGYATQNTIQYSIMWYTYDVPSTIEVRYRKNNSWYGFSVKGTPTSAPHQVSAGSGTIDAIYFRHTPSGGSTQFINMSLAVLRTKPLSINDRTTSIATSHSTTGDVRDRGVDTAGKAIKDVDDVDNLSEANRQLENISTTSSSKKVVDLFDLTENLETISWSFFKDRKIQVVYVGSTDDAEVVITFAYFEVEYRQRETVITNDVTCRPVGSLISRPDAIIQYLLADVAGVPIESMGSIFVDVDEWNDVNIWVDANIWRDAGERLPVADDPAFLDAAERFNFLGYRLDGVISADETVQDSVKKICRQTRSRLIWSAGLVKLAVREKSEDWSTVRLIGKSETRLRSMRVEKAPVLEIENDINLSYQVDRLSDADGEGKFDAAIVATDLSSIERHGQKKKTDEWLFDLVRDPTMAADLADYYIWRYGEPITRYKLTSYLSRFEVEKEDVIRITSDFTRISQLPIRVVENAREFGSGKLARINTIRFTGESIRHKLWYIQLEDTVLTIDDISIDSQTESDINDNAAVIETIETMAGYVLDDDSASVSDQILLQIAYVSSFTESAQVVEDVTSSFLMILADSVSAFDAIIVQYEPCFGACGFGGRLPGCDLPFGAPTILRSGFGSDTGVSDSIEIAVDYVLELEDTVLVEDDDLNVEYALGDQIGFTEDLIFNTCFGCTVEGATGFGLNNFGR